MNLNDNHRDRMKPRDWAGLAAFVSVTAFLVGSFVTLGVVFTHFVVTYW